MSVIRTTTARPVDVVAGGVRWSRRVVVGTLLLTLLATPLPTAAYDLLVLVLVAAGLLAGLPHGAVDHRVAARLTGWPTPVVTAAYAATAALTWVLLVEVGAVVLLPVLALSLLHFALGELEVVRETTSWRPSRVAAVAFAAAGTGALVLPLARSGAQLAGVASSISPTLGTLLAAPTSRVALAALWVVAAAVAATSAFRARQTGVLVDLLLVGALGLLAPPLVAFAVWFGGWHALRHSARLLTVDQPAAGLVAAGRPRAAVRALARAALWPSLAAVLVLVVLLVVTLSAADPLAAVGGTLLVLLALTVPHMVVVLWLDRRRVPLG